MFGVLGGGGDRHTRNWTNEKHRRNCTEFYCVSVSVRYVIHAMECQSRRISFFLLGIMTPYTGLTYWDFSHHSDASPSDEENKCRQDVSHRKDTKQKERR